LKLSELATLLGGLGYPVAYSHFKESKTNPVPKPPFIIYQEEESDNYGADNQVWKKVKNYRIELYSDKKDLKMESKVEDLLDEYGIFYDTNELFIVAEDLFQRTYFITLIN